MSRGIRKRRCGQIPGPGQSGLPYASRLGVTPKGTGTERGIGWSVYPNNEP